MAIPKYFQQFFVGDLSRVIVNLNRLGVVTQAVISGVLCSPARIANTSANYTRDTPEPGVRAPESAQGKSRRFSPGWR